MIKDFIDFLNKGIEGDIEAFRFSIRLEDYLIDNYDKMLAENKELTDYANEVLPDIAEQMEPGMDPTKFISELVRERDYMIERYL